MVRIVISFLCVLGALFIFVIVTNPIVELSKFASAFLTIIPVIFLAGANLVRVSAFSSPKAIGYDFIKYIGAVLVLIILGVSFSYMTELFGKSTWSSLYAAWLVLLQIGFLVTPFLGTRVEKEASL